MAIIAVVRVMRSTLIVLYYIIIHILLEKCGSDSQLLQCFDHLLTYLPYVSELTSRPDNKHPLYEHCVPMKITLFAVQGEHSALKELHVQTDPRVLKMGTAVHILQHPPPHSLESSHRLPGRGGGH